MKKIVVVVAVVAGAIAAVGITLFYVGRALVAAQSPSTEPLTAEEHQRLQACETLMDERWARRQAAQEAELKDPAWAAATERKVSDYAARRFAPGDIEVIAIDCRTTYCSFTLRLLSPEARGKLSKALPAVLKDKELRSEFGSVSATQPDKSVEDIFRMLLNRRTREQPAPIAPSKDDVQAETCAQLLHQWQYRPAPAKSP
jgi:hypothetical protein